MADLIQMNRPERNSPCWICQGSEMSLVRRGTAAKNLSASDFRITDSRYGLTSDIYQCGHCGFQQCPDLGDPTEFYRAMSDESYEQTRSSRAIQERKLLAQIRKWVSAGRLLDVGAGSGILVEEALRLGYQAEGVEPSEKLVEVAKGRALPIHLGTLGTAGVDEGGYDVVTCVDVIEHVTNPRQLMSDIAAALNDNGVALIVTPDRESLAARSLRWRWWHYRIAHVGYFSRKNFERLADDVGLTVVARARPWWFFELGYLWERAFNYAPEAVRFKAPTLAARLLVPVNLFDSWMFVCRRR